MSCFGCCEEDDIGKHADGGGHYMMKNSVGKSENPIFRHSHEGHQVMTINFLCISLN